MEKEVSSYCVQRLREDSEYMFRVIAENPVGVSEALESETITVRSKFGELRMILKLLPHQQWLIHLIPYGYIRHMGSYIWHPGIQNTLKSGCVWEKINLKAASSNSKTDALFLTLFWWYLHRWCLVTDVNWPSIPSFWRHSSHLHMCVFIYVYIWFLIVFSRF